MGNVMSFDYLKYIGNCSSILEGNQELPSFHDAEVYSVNLWRGDLRPDDKIWVFPTIDVAVEVPLAKEPFVVDFKFHDCSDINVNNFNYDNMIFDLVFNIEERGFFADGKTPLPPYICVDFTYMEGPSFLSFKCFQAEVINRRPVPEPPRR